MLSCQRDGSTGVKERDGTIDRLTEYESADREREREKQMKKKDQETREIIRIQKRNQVKR